MDIDSAKPDGHVLRHESLPFIARCPRCKHQRPQRGYNRAALQRLLKRGHPVEAYCAVCDEYWAVSAEELARIVATLVD